MHAALDNLNIPQHYKDYIIQVTNGLSRFEFIKRLYLFGSCAKGLVNSYSDVDLLIITDNKISDEIICNQVMDILPELDGSDVYSDMIFLSEDEVAKNINTLGHISRVVLKGGVDLSERLCQCRIKGESRQSLVTI